MMMTAATPMCEKRRSGTLAGGPKTATFRPISLPGSRCTACARHLVNNLLRAFQIPGYLSRGVSHLRAGKAQMRAHGRGRRRFGDKATWESPTTARVVAQAPAPRPWRQTLLRVGRRRGSSGRKLRRLGRGRAERTAGGVGGHNPRGWQTSTHAHLCLHMLRHSWPRAQRAQRRHLLLRDTLIRYAL